MRICEWMKKKEKFSRFIFSLWGTIEEFTFGLKRLEKKIFCSNPDVYTFSFHQVVVNYSQSIKKIKDSKFAWPQKEKKKKI